MKCPLCNKEDCVFEKHTVWVEPVREEPFEKTLKRINEEITEQELNPTTFLVECIACGAEWKTQDEFWEDVDKARLPGESNVFRGKEGDTIRKILYGIAKKVYSSLNHEEAAI